METLYENGHGALPVPPRGRPLFLPTVHETYAIDVARIYHCCTEAEGEAGFVTAFQVNGECERLFVPTAIGNGEKDVWRQPYEMPDVNDHLAGLIRVISALYGVGSPGWIPSEGPSAGLNAKEQIQRLANLLRTEFIEVVREVAGNPKPIFMNYGYWLQHSPEELEIAEDAKDQTLGIILQVWRDQFPHTLLPGSPEASSLDEIDEEADVIAEE